MPLHGERHRRDRPLCSSPEPPLRVSAAGRWIRSGRGPPEFVQARPPVLAAPGGTLGASLVTLGGNPRDARPQTIATVLECGWIPPAAGARRESPGFRGAGVRGVCTKRSRAHRFRKPVWLIKVRTGMFDGLRGGQQRVEQHAQHTSAGCRSTECSSQGLPGVTRRGTERWPVPHARPSKGSATVNRVTHDHGWLQVKAWARAALWDSQLTINRRCLRQASAPGSSRVRPKVVGHQLRADWGVA
jgi:hypothetical protein